MNREEICTMAENDHEWRRHILTIQLEQSRDMKEIRSEIRSVKKSVSGMNVKLAGFASFFALVGAYLKSKFIV